MDFMDFDKFEQWCEDRGFLVRITSGRHRVGGVKVFDFFVNDFSKFKSFFNLCVMFFNEEQLRQDDQKK
nr:MAG TPA: hypothetical protein [Caudoviricetes sp.]